MLLPEDVINNYQFTDQPQINELKTYLINYYNLMTLRKYKECEQFLSSEEILQQMPNQIINFYSLSKQIEKLSSLPLISTKSKGFWADDKQLLEQFTTFVKTKYKVVDTPSLKFKDLMLDFTKETNIETTYTWSNKYEVILTNLEIKFEKVVDPRFAQKGGNGTCYVYLKSLLDKPKHVIPLEVNKKYEGIIPPIPFNKSTIPKIPKS